MQNIFVTIPLLLVIALTGSCATTPRLIQKPVSQLVSSSRAALVAGCLLPPLAAYTSDPLGSNLIVMEIWIEPNGVPARGTVVRSSGEPQLDAAYVSAALKCRYVAATLGANTMPGSYRLEHSWDRSRGFAGPLRCFAPEYPRSSLRNERVGTVRVQFRVGERADEHAAVRLAGEVPDVSLGQASIDAVAKCLEHREAREGLQTDQWYELPFNFMIK